MIAVNRRVTELLVQKYHKELERCKTEKEVIRLIYRVARNENLRVNVSNRPPQNRAR